MSARSSTSRGIRALLAIGLLAALGAAAPRQAPMIARLEWLTGCWERRAGTHLVEEQWMAPRGGTMLGMSRTVRGDTLVEYEQVRIFERGGKLVYAAHPSGQPPAEFVSVEVGDSVVVFENPKHDFPQRILYCRVGLDSLVARVEGTSRGRKRSVEFPYVHIACPSGGPSPTR